MSHLLQDIELYNSPDQVMPPRGHSVDDVIYFLAEDIMAEENITQKKYLENFAMQIAPFGALDVKCLINLMQFLTKEQLECLHFINGSDNTNTLSGTRGSGKTTVIIYYCILEKFHYQRKVKISCFSSQKENEFISIIYEKITRLKLYILIHKNIPNFDEMEKLHCSHETQTRLISYLQNMLVIDEPDVFIIDDYDCNYSDTKKQERERLILKQKSVMVVSKIPVNNDAHTTTVLRQENGFDYEKYFKKRIQNKLLFI